MGADSKNQVENMCCQHKIYDIIKYNIIPGVKIWNYFLRKR